MILAWLPGSALERFSGQLTRRAAAPRSPAPRELITLPAALGQSKRRIDPATSRRSALRVRLDSERFRLCASRDVAQRLRHQHHTELPQVAVGPIRASRRSIHLYSTQQHERTSTSPSSWSRPASARPSRRRVQWRAKSVSGRAHRQPRHGIAGGDGRRGRCGRGLGTARNFHRDRQRSPARRNSGGC
jgi:hypothetical protein